MGLTFLPSPSEDEQQTRDIAQAFANTQLRPYAIADDENKHFRREVFNELAALGLNCLAIPETFGGKGLSHSCHYACLEEIARASLSMAVTIGVHSLAQGAVLRFGSSEQQEKFLKPLVRGELLGAFSLSEPQSGSDAASLICSATKKDNGYLLNGAKLFVSSQGNADLYLLFARTGKHKSGGVSAFLLPKDTPGFQMGKVESKMGLNASSLGELVFEDCFIPDSLRLGEEGAGMKIALSQLDAGRITIGATSLALTTEAIERAWRFLALQEKEHGTKFTPGQKQALAQKFSEAQAVRVLITCVSQLKDEGQPIHLLASQVKLLCSDLAVSTTSEAISLVGPLGASQSLEFERLFRDAKALQIVEGTNQVQKIVISREMKRMFES